MWIALIVPPNRSDTYYDSGHSCIHLGIGYIASALEKNGHKVDIYECSLQNIDVKSIIRILTSKEYNAIGFTTYYYNIMQVYRISQKIKKYKDIFIFTGGIFSSMNYQDVLKRKSIDCCVLGEGEETVVKLMDCINEKADVNTVDGIAFIKKDKIIITNKRKCLIDLNRLMFPKRSYFFKDRVSSMVASRGCNGNCSFCGINNYYKQYTTRSIRIRSPENVVDEMEQLERESNVNYIFFQDENIFATTLINQNWIRSFCEDIQKRNLQVKFYAYARADDILNHKEDLQLLKSAGLDCVFVGIESFVERQLKLYNKRILPEVNVEVIKLIKDMQLNINIGFILFDPYLTIKEFKCNVEKLLSSKFYENCYFTQSPISCLGPLYPMQYTQFYNELIELKMFDDSIFHKYKFVDPDIEYLYGKLDDWKLKVSIKYAEIDTEYKKINVTDEEGFNTCLSRLRNLLKTDLEFLNEIANIYIYSDEQYKSIFNKYCVRLENIKRMEKKSRCLL